MTYDYFDVQRLSYLAFGWPVRSLLQIGKSSGISVDGVGFRPPRGMKRWYVDEYRSEATVNGRSLRAYLQSMEKHLEEARRVLFKGGIVAYAVADSIRSTRTFRLSLAIRSLLRDAGFGKIETCTRALSSRRILPAGRDPSSGRFTSDAGPSIEERIIFAVLEGGR